MCAEPCFIVLWQTAGVSGSLLAMEMGCPAMRVSPAWPIVFALPHSSHLFGMGPHPTKGLNPMKLLGPFLLGSCGE